MCLVSPASPPPHSPPYVQAGRYRYPPTASAIGFGSYRNCLTILAPASSLAFKAQMSFHPATSSACSRAKNSLRTRLRYSVRASKAPTFGRLSTITSSFANNSRIIHAPSFVPAGKAQIPASRLAIGSSFAKKRRGTQTLAYIPEFTPTFSDHLESSSADRSNPPTRSGLGQSYAPVSTRRQRHSSESYSSERTHA